VKQPVEALDPTVKAVADAGKADQKAFDQKLDQQSQQYDNKVKQQNQAANQDTKKLEDEAAAAKKKKEDAAKAAAAGGGAASPPGAPGAAKVGPDGKPLDKKPVGPIGTKISLDILGKTHTLYIEDSGVAMVAPNPTPADSKVGDLAAAVGAAPDDIKSHASASAQTAQAAATKLAADAKKAATGDDTAKSAAGQSEQTLAEPLKITWKWAEVAKDPAVTSGSIEDPLKHPYYKTFTSRLAALSDKGHVSVDVAPFAEAMWLKICKAVKAANPSISDPQAYSKFAKSWFEAKSPEFVKALKELDKLGMELAKAASSQLATAQNFGFWSMEEGRALAESMPSDVSFETSAVGKLMDGLPTLDGAKGGWDPEIWGALSKAYAAAVVPEVLKGKKVKVSVGAGAGGNIWETVESLAVSKGLEKAGVTLEASSTYYAAAAKSKANRKELDQTKQANGIKGVLYVGSKGGAIAAANAHYAKIPDVAAATPAPGTAPAPGQPATPGADTKPVTPSAVSKHAAGPAPAGWRTKVFKAVASTAVVADDPGHTYHMLKDGNAVTTSEENKLADAEKLKLQGVVNFVPPPKPPLTYDEYGKHIKTKFAAQIKKLDEISAESKANGGDVRRKNEGYKVTLQDISKLEVELEAAKATLDKKKIEQAQNKLDAAQSNKDKTMADLLAKAQQLVKDIKAKGASAVAEKTALEGVMQISLKLAMQLDPEATMSGRSLYVTLDTTENPALIQMGRDAGMTDAEIAQMAVDHRNFLRKLWRSEVMKDQTNAEILYLRDLGLQGSRDGMTLDQVLAKIIKTMPLDEATKKAALSGNFTLMTPEELAAMYKGVVGSAGQTNAGVNATAGVKKEEDKDKKDPPPPPPPSNNNDKKDPPPPPPPSNSNDKKDPPPPPPPGNTAASNSTQTKTDPKTDTKTDPKADPKTDPKTDPKNEVSKHAAGPPPAGWQGNVLKSVPSTEVAPDDPGHTYHLLKDGKGVTTTEPKSLAGAETTGLQNKLRGKVPFDWEIDPNRQQPDFEKHARTFEAKLAPVAVGASNDIAGRMAASALEYMRNKAKAKAGTDKIPEVEAELDKLIALCGMTEKAFAGAVGKDPKVIRQILMTAQEHKRQAAEAKAKGHDLFDAPTIREQMTFIRNFFRAVLSKDLVASAADTAKYLGGTKDILAKMEERRAAAVAAAKGKPIEDKDIYDAVPPNPDQGGQKTIKGDPNKGAEAQKPLAITHQEEARVDVSDVKDVQDPTRVSNQPNQTGDAKKDRKARGATDREGGVGVTTQTVGDQKAFPLSSREKANMGVSDDADKLTWNEGGLVWYQNQKNAWVQAIEELQLPFTGGPSGLSNSYLNAVQILMGGSQGDMLSARLALIGHLQHINAHSCVEVLAAGAGFGLSFTAGQTMYTDIAPLSEAQLRLCGRPGGPKGNLFPHEPDEVK
jgi:hypothetical protein